MHEVAGINPLYTASGFGVGMLVGLTGVGGGALMTPLLVLLFGIHPATAVGTDLLYAAVTKSVGTAVHGFNRTVDWRIVGRLAAGSMPATAATIAVLYQIGSQNGGSSKLISCVVGAAVLVTAVLLLGRSWLLAMLGERFGADGPRHAASLTMTTGVLLGVLVTLSSVGAGALGVTALFLLYPRMPTARIIGSDIAHAVPLTLLAGIGHWLLGSVDWHLLLSLLTGSIPGIILGSLIATRVSENVVRPALACVLLVVGGRLVF
jgi:uncharacterized membrane protein YfcA